jgi:hypothetical protein
MNIFEKSLIRGFIIGVFLAIINTFLYGILGIIFIPVLVLVPFLASDCSGEECWRFILSGDILFIISVPVAFVFYQYVFDMENFPYSQKKNFKIVFIVIIGMVISAIGFLEVSLVELSANFNGFGLHTFSSTEECDNILRSTYYNKAGECYGYFASRKSDISYCDNIKGIKDASDTKNVAGACIASFAIQKNDIKNCAREQGCMKTYYVAKLDRAGCRKINDEYWRNKCNTQTNMYFSLARRYAKIKGVDFNNFNP